MKCDDQIETMTAIVERTFRDKAMISVDQPVFNIIPKEIMTDERWLGIARAINKVLIDYNCTKKYLSFKDITNAYGEALSNFTSNLMLMGM